MMNLLSNDPTITIAPRETPSSATVATREPPPAVPVVVEFVLAI